MLYLFHGTDFKKARAAHNSFLDALRAKRPDATVVTFDEFSFSSSVCEEHIVSQGLFETHVIIKCDNVFGNPDAALFFKTHAKDLKQSKNVFVFLEGDLPKDTADALSEYAEKAWRFDFKNTKKKNSGNFFSIPDAIGKRDRRGAWVLLQEAYRRGEPPEKIHGQVFWQFKNLYMVKDAEGKGDDALYELGLNPFVLKKTRSFSRNYSSTKELAQFLRELVCVYHDAHRGGLPLDAALERFILTL